VFLIIGFKNTNFNLNFKNLKFDELYHDLTFFEKSPLKGLILKYEQYVCQRGKFVKIF